jgi:hypothetical protein
MLTSKSGAAGFETFDEVFVEVHVTFLIYDIHDFACDIALDCHASLFWGACGSDHV